LNESQWGLVAQSTFPFTAIVGQERMKLALVLNAIDPSIGGVLIRGEKGTAKSTAVRALARLLPEQMVVKGCRFGCHPEDQEALCLECREREEGLEKETRRMRVVELPVNASEDRVVGTIDLEAALREGEKKFEPGVLAEANRNILYVDEVNLLDDHIVDVLLDAAAMGVNVVEREGVSITHPSRFILVGTMNPEEGELRPQLLDRFGLCVDVQSIRDLDQRVEIAERDLLHRSSDPAFTARYGEHDRDLVSQLGQALVALPEVFLESSQVRLISSICLETGVQGHRGDVITGRAGRALAALRGHPRPDRKDIYDAAALALAHRARRPWEEPGSVESEPGAGDQADSTPDEVEADAAPQQQGTAGGEQQGVASASGDSGPGNQGAASEQGNAGPSSARQDSEPEVHETFTLRVPELPRRRAARKQAGKRASSQSADHRGRYVAAAAPSQVTDLALDATLRAAAPYQLGRGRVRGGRVQLEKQDLRQKVRERKSGNLIVFVVDASASMDAEQRMAATKGAIFSLLQDAYIRRDRVAVVVFKNRTAELALHPTSSVQMARKRLENLSVGGTTPLTHGLMAGYKIIRTELSRDPSVRPLLVLISDGRGNISMFKEEPLVEARKLAATINADRIEALVIDSARDFSQLPSVQHLARVAPMYQTYAINACSDLAERMGAQYYGLYDLSRDEIASAVSRRLGR
jgi:magnesium chelatase subunit D